MGALRINTLSNIEKQEQSFDKRFAEVVSYFEKEFYGLPFESTDLETLKYDKIKNITVYVDYAVRGEERRIELHKVNVMNSDDDYLLTAERNLQNALSEIVEKVNKAIEAELENEYTYHEYEAH